MKKLKIFAIMFCLTFLAGVSIALTPRLPLEKPLTTPTINLETWTNYLSMPHDQGLICVYLRALEGSYFSDIETFWYNTPNPSAIGVNANYYYQVLVRLSFNQTHLQIPTPIVSNYPNYVKCNITVRNNTGDVVFFDQNGTFQDYDSLGNNIYFFEQIWNFTFATQYNQEYNVSIQYDTYTWLNDYYTQSYYFTNDMSNTTWDFALNDLVQAQIGGSNKFTFNGADGYGYAQDDVSFSFPVNSWIEYRMDWVRDYGTMNVYYTVQMYIGGAWYYDIGGQLTDFEGPTTFYVNMSAWSGMSCTWVIYNLKNAEVDDQFQIDYWRLYVNNTVENRTWEYIGMYQIELVGPLFEGSLLAGISLIGLCMIPSGAGVGAWMIKTKQLNDENWLLPLFIILLGFALFIGGLAG